MTLDEIFAWIAATPGQPHAIGRYQFIPDTLRMLVNRLVIGLSKLAIGIGWQSKQNLSC